MGSADNQEGGARAMDAAAFWELIDKTREAAGGDPRKQHDLLINELAQLPENEILSFDEIC
jgi:hypothetical protein